MKTDESGSSCNDLLAAWDMAHDALTDVAESAKRCRHVEFAREAETIADSLESRVTALCNIAMSRVPKYKRCPKCKRSRYGRKKVCDCGFNFRAADDRRANDQADRPAGRNSKTV